VGGSVLRMSRGLNGSFPARGQRYRRPSEDVFGAAYHPSPPGRHVLGVRCIGVSCECPRTRCSGLRPKHGAPLRSGWADERYAGGRADLVTTSSTTAIANAVA